MTAGAGAEGGVERRAIVLDSQGGALSVRHAEEIIARVQAGELNPIDALDLLVQTGEVVIREEQKYSESIASALASFAIPEMWGPHKRVRSLPRPPRESHSATYFGSQGRGKVTFAEGEAIVSRLKPSGAWKRVVSHPWPEPLEGPFRVNASLREICGPDFYVE